MAEGFGRHYHGETINFISAGTKKHGLNQKAVKVMDEVGVDISQHYSKTLEELEGEVDLVVTVCEDARERCPYFPGKKIVHRGFEDPPRLAKTLNDEEEINSVYRRVRDEIAEYIKNIDEFLK